MTPRLIHRLGNGLALLLLAACSTVPDKPPPPSVLAANGQLEQWQLSGKIGLRNGSEGHSAYLNWRQCGQHYDIRLTGPLGQGAAHLVGDEHQARLDTSDQQRYFAATAEQLLAQHFGWTLPVSQLFYWVRGIPTPDQAHRLLPETSGFQQDQWRLSFPRLIAVEHYQLPAKAVAEQAPYKVTLVIKDWQLLPDCDTD